MNAFFGSERGDDVFGVGPARYQTLVDKRGDLDVPQSGLGESFDQLDFIRGGDRAGFDLEPLARAFLVDLHMCRQVGHELALRVSV
jgi:hypothetical protein